MKHDVPAWIVQRPWTHVFCCLTLLAFVATKASAATIVWTNTAGGNWSVPANWNPNTAPGFGDNILITNSGNYTVNLDIDSTVASLVVGSAIGQQVVSIGSKALTLEGMSQIKGGGRIDMAAGTLAGAGTLTNDGVLNCSSGTINLSVINNGSMITANAAINGLFSTGTGSIVSIRDAIGPNPSVTVFGTGFVNKGTLSFANGGTGRIPTLAVTSGTLVNDVGAIMEFGWSGGQSGTQFTGALDNRGTINVLLTTTIQSIGGNVNSGSINVQAGSFTVMGSGAGLAFTNTGSITVADGELTYTQPADGVMVNSGVIQLTNTRVLSISGGNYRHLGGRLMAGEVNFGSVLLDCVSTLTNASGISMYLGLCTVNGSVVNLGTIKTAATAFGGPFIASPGSTLSIRETVGPDPSVTSFANGFMNNGTIAFANGGSGRKPALTVTNGTLTNASGATIEFAWLNNQYTGALDNRGTINVFAGTTIYSTGLSANSGTINVLSGYLSVQLLSGSVSWVNSGSISLAGGDCTVALAGGSFTNSGNIFVGAERTFQSSAGTFVPVLTLSTSGSGMIATIPFQTSFTNGQTVMLTALPYRWWTFASWADGVANNSRSVTLGLTNNYTALFTNLVQLESVNIGGSTRTAPVGAPVVLLNGQWYSNNVVLATNGLSFTVQLQSTFPNATIFYTTNGSEPSEGEMYSGSFSVAAPFSIRAVAYSEDFSMFTEADAVNTFLAMTPGGGIVAVSVQLDPLTGASTVALTATPLAGWNLVNWSGDAIGTNAMVALAMNGPKSALATFGTTLTTSGSGQVLQQPSLAMYPYGSTVRLTAVPTNATTYFRQWGGAASGQFVNPLNFTVTNATQSVSAVFFSLPGSNRSLTVLVNGEGSVTKNPQQSNYANNATVTLTASPASRSVFVAWSGDASGTTNAFTVVMNTNKTIGATFTIPPALTVRTPTNGTVVSADGVLVEASATDPDGQIARVEFHSSASVIGILTNPPYSLVWSNLVGGTNRLTVKAVDNLGITTDLVVDVYVPPPRIISMTPTVGKVGSPVVIHGVNFSTLSGGNIVHFGATRAMVTASTNDCLTVITPAGATAQPISVTTHGLTAYSATEFLPSFDGTGMITTNSFAVSVDFPDPNGASDAKVVDLDGDGRPDLACANGSLNLLSLYRSLFQLGGISSNSFVGPTDLPPLGSSLNAAIGDLDGDGRLDIAIANAPDADGPQASVALYRNLNNTGTISNTLFVGALPAPGSWPESAAIADLDLDGKPDVILSSYTRGSVLIFRNIGGGGSLATNTFAAPIEIVTTTRTYQAIAGDIDGDGRPEILIPNLTGANRSISILRNQTTPGALSVASFGERFDLVTSGAPYQLGLVDLDRDGKLDLVVVHLTPHGPENEVWVYRNTAMLGTIDGNSFAAPVMLPGGGTPVRMSVGDLNGDGKPDLVFADGNGIVLFQNNSSTNNFSFTRVGGLAAGRSAYNVTVADIDLDGKPDIVLPWAGAVSIYRNLSAALGVVPGIAITMPSNGAVFVSPANVSINVAVINGSNPVIGVDFYAGSSFIGRATNSSFSFEWANVPNGTYMLTAVATDNSGLSATSSPVSVTVSAPNQPPLVSITSPSDGAFLATGTDVPFTANAADVDGGSVTLVQFFVDGSLLGSDAQASFGLTWSNVPAGTHVLTARATDNGGLISTSAPVTVTVSLFEGPPAFRFELPGYSVSEGGASVTLRVIRNFSGFATVNFATGDGSATAGADYNAASGQLLFQSSESVKPIVVTVLEDFVVEGNHTFSVTLSLPSSGGLASPSVATVTILDNDVQTGSSFLSIVPPSAVNTNDLGSLRVFLTVDAGPGVGQWRLPWERSWRDSGTAAGGLQPGLYEIEFKPLGGYLPPPPATMAVNASQESRSTNAYTFLVNTPPGSLTVFIEPANVAANADPGCRGQWSIPGYPFMDSGATVSALPSGSYMVSFKGLNAGCGWSTPLPREAVVRPGLSNSFRVSYVTNVAGVSVPAALNFANDIQNSYANQQPFTFVGQVTTEFGEGSGVVVKERVVLTAAHVVFDDFSLSWIGDAHWFFQRHAPDYNPAPQEVRGYYVNAGYAAQRQAEGTPGVSSPASFDLDVAALYFYEAAGRGGYGGYLVSETPTPQWLQTNALKALVGYPVEGITPSGLGKMHTIGPTSMSFNQTTGAVFTCTQIRGLPGNSGGPLLVKFAGNNYFYPAGIYVGGSDRAIVRAIDSRAVELINAAELTSNLGTNQTGGGVVRFGVSVPAGTCFEFATVTLAPPAAIAAGALYRVHYKPSTNRESLSPWTNSSAYKVILNNKPDFIELADAEGFITPDPVNLELVCRPAAPAPSTNLVFTYVQVLPRLDVLASDRRHLVLSGLTNRTYRIEHNTRLGTTNGWTTLTNVTFPAHSDVTVISNALLPVATNRFLRAVRVP